LALVALEELRTLRNRVRDLPLSSPCMSVSVVALVDLVR
jgi:hypothetical protein